MKSAYADPLLLRFLARVIARMISPRTRCIAASGYGGIPLGTAVSLETGLPLTLVREAPKEHGRSARVDGYVPRNRERVALVDDVYSSGTGMRAMERVLRRHGAHIVSKIVVVSRAERLPSDVQALALLGDIRETNTKKLP
jgi:orotate phosphoribosyltransferase